MIAILILAHKNPQQLHRLLCRLQHPLVQCFVHLDGKSNLDDFCSSRNLAIFIDQAVQVNWGDFSQIQAILHSLEQISQSHGQASHVLLISGQDYPLKKMDDLTKDLANNHSEHILCMPISKSEWNIQHRYEKFRCKSRNKFLDTLSLILPYRRKHPMPKVWGGSQWWGLSMPCIRYILSYCQSNPAYSRFHQWVHIPDELFFQTLVMNSPFAPDVQGYKRLIRWQGNSANPKILGIQDWDEIKQCGMWFARKFDPQIDSEILDRIDQWLGFEVTLK